MRLIKEIIYCQKVCTKRFVKEVSLTREKNTDENLDLQIGVRAQEIENVWVDKRYLYIANLFNR